MTSGYIHYTLLPDSIYIVRYISESDMYVSGILYVDIVCV